MWVTRDMLWSNPLGSCPSVRVRVRVRFRVRVGVRVGGEGDG